MQSKRWSVRGMVLATTVVAFALAAPASTRADGNKEQPKGKGDKKGGVVQLDLGKLPPDLAKQLQKYLAGDDKKVEKEKGKASGKQEVPQLPPGLAKKPADHPGRVAFLKNAGQKTPGAKNYEKEKGQVYGKRGGPQLPPGLASKPIDHPGRMAFLKNANQKGQDDKKKGKGGKDKSDKDDD